MSVSRTELIDALADHFGSIARYPELAPGATMLAESVDTRA